MGTVARRVVTGLNDQGTRPHCNYCRLETVAIDLALVRRSIEQLAANQDQVARKQEQMTQAIATLQAAVQDISQKFFALAPPAPKAVRVPPKPAPPEQ